MAFYLLCALVAASLTYAQTTVVELQSDTSFYLKTSSSATFTLASTIVVVPAVPLSTTLTVSYTDSDTTSNSPIRSTWIYAPPSTTTQPTQISQPYGLIQSNTPAQDVSSVMSTSIYNALSVLSCAIATFESGVTAPCIAASTAANNMATVNTVTVTALTQVTDIATAVSPSTTLQIISASPPSTQGVTVVVLPGQPTSTTVQTATQIFTSTINNGNLPGASSTIQITGGFAGMSSNTALSTATTLVTSTSVSTITTGLGGIIVGGTGSSSTAAQQTSNATPSSSASGAASGTVASNTAAGTGASGTGPSGTGANTNASASTSNSAGASSAGSSIATRTSISTVTTTPAASSTAAASNAATSTTGVRSATITPAPVASQGPYAGASAIGAPYLLSGFAAVLAAIFAQ